MEEEADRAADPEEAAADPEAMEEAAEDQTMVMEDPGETTVYLVTPQAAVYFHSSSRSRPAP